MEWNSIHLVRIISAVEQNQYNLGVAFHFIQPQDKSVPGSYDRFHETSNYVVHSQHCFNYVHIWM